nr:uncharacterized protein LOC129527973 [Gorilla gorilla gorilla]
MVYTSCRKQKMHCLDGPSDSPPPRLERQRLPGRARKQVNPRPLPPQPEEHSTGKGRNASNEHVHNFSKHAVHVAPPKCPQATTQVDSPGQPAPGEESREEKQKPWNCASI